MCNTSSTQKIIKCKLVHANRDPGTRFVELESYKVWSYLMTSKHSFVVADIALHFWAEESEYEQRKFIYDKHGEPELVDRIEVLLYDENIDYCLSTCRFAPHGDVDKIQKILLSHISKEMRTSKNYQVIVQNGYSFKIKDNIESLVNGLAVSEITSC